MIEPLDGFTRTLPAPHAPIYWWEARRGGPSRETGAMANGRIETLRHAVRWRVLLKYLGVLGLVLAALDAVSRVNSVLRMEGADE